MLITSDFHIHSEYSYDAHLPLRTIAEGAKACGFSRIGIDQRHLLEIHRKEKGNRAAQTAKEQFFVEETEDECFSVLFLPVSNVNYRQKAHCAHGAADGLECDGANPIHAHRLGDESAAPNERCDKKQNCRAKFRL